MRSEKKNKRIPIKKISFICALVLAVSTVCGCGARQKSEAQLVAEFNKHISFDFGLLEDVGSTNMNGYKVSIPTEYSTDYYLAKYEEEYKKGQTAGEYVYYSVTAYPAYTSGGHYVTMIFCSDPSITFFGVNLLFSLENIESAFNDAGYETELTYKNSTRYLRAYVTDSIVFGVYETEDGHKYFAVGATVLEDKHSYDFFK